MRATVHPPHMSTLEVAQYAAGVLWKEAIIHGQLEGAGQAAEIPLAQPVKNPWHVDHAVHEAHALRVGLVVDVGMSRRSRCGNRVAGSGSIRLGC